MEEITNDKEIKNSQTCLEVSPGRWSQTLGFFFPLLFSLAILGVVFIVFGKNKVLELISLVLLSFFALGKFLPFAAVIPLEGVNIKISFSPWELAAVVVCMDTLTAIFVMYNVHILEKIYWIGPKIKGIRMDCYYLLKANKWANRIASVFIALFVAFPVAGTGAVSGGFLSALLGFKRLYSIFVIFIGSVLGCFGMALGAVLLKARLKEFLENPVVFYSGIVIVILLLIWAAWKLKRMIAKQKALEESQRKGIESEQKGTEAENKTEPS